MSTITSVTPYKHGGYGSKVDVNEYRKRAQGEIAELLGDVDLKSVAGGVNLDAWSSHASLKTGLAFELSGRATIVQARVSPKTEFRPTACLTIFLERWLRI
jgi:hypothetical protein